MGDDYGSALRNWYEGSARPFLQQHIPDRLEVFDRDLQRLLALETAGREPLTVCVLGSAGVGKSTLINAAVAGAQTVLPQGGVGPLTAQATMVSHSTERFFRATYLPRKKLNELLFALERNHELQLRQQGVVVAEQTEELKAELTPEEREQLAMVAPAVPTADGDVDDKLEAYKKQARLLVRGDQFADIELPALLDAIRTAMGLRPRWGATLRGEDQPRLDGIRTALQRGHRECRAGASMPEFVKELHLHAAGYLSPLIATLEVGWDGDILKDNLLLVDLPGLGVANDEYARVTAEWIRKARAIVLVVDRSGVNESSADLLRSTGFLNTLLHDSHDTDKLPVHLLVAVVKLDLSADDARNLEKQTNQPPFRRWVEHFDSACERAIVLLKDQTRLELTKIADAGADSTRAERRAVIDRVLASLQIHPVSALEYRKLLQEDEEERARVKNAEETRVPTFVGAVRRIAAEHQGDAAQRALATTQDLHDRLVAALELVRAQWERDSRADDEAAKLQEELERFLKPLREQLLVRHGAFREFLRQSIPDQIEARLEEATLTAKDDIGKYLRRLSGYHWATLRAAVRRGGTFVGAKHVDIPKEVTLRFEEPVAIVWSKYILAALRKRTRELGDDYVQLVGQVVEWTRGQGTRVQPKLVEAIHQDLTGDVKELSNVGKEAIDDLREKVKTQLYDHVCERVRKKCVAFVEDRRDVGTGVKSRIVDFLFDELLDAIIEGAKPTAKKVLSGNYEVVQKEITTLFEKLDNPLERAANGIVDSEKARLRRSDAQRRKRVLDQAKETLAAQPRREGRRA